MRRENIFLSKDRSHVFLPLRSKANRLSIMPTSSQASVYFLLEEHKLFLHVPFSGVWDNVFQEPEIQPRVLRNHVFKNNISRLPSTVLQENSATTCLPVTDPDLKLRRGGGRFFF